MTTPSDPTTQGWASPARPDGPRPDDAGPAPAQADSRQPVPPASASGSSAVPGSGAASGAAAGSGSTGVPVPPPVPPGGWGPGYTSPAGGPPGYGPGYGPGSAPPPPRAPGAPRGGAPYGGAPYGYVPPAPRPGIIPLRPLGLGEILDGAFRAIRANPRVMFGLSAVVVAVAVAVQSVIQWYLTGLLAGELAQLGATLDPGGELGFAETMAPGIAALLTTPLISIAVTVLTGLLIVSVSRSVIGQTISVGEVWSQSWRRVGLLVVFSVTTTLVILAVWAGFVAVLALLADGEQWGAMATVGIVGALALLAATVWFSIRILLVPASLVLEGTKVTTAIRRAWRLTRGSFWRLLGIYLLTSAMVAVVASLVVTPATMVASLVLRDPLLTSFGGIALTAVSNIVAYTLTTAFMAAVLALLYVDVRMRREGLDVELARAADAG